VVAVSCAETVRENRNNKINMSGLRMAVYPVF
jgi:hypothetical protein